MKVEEKEKLFKEIVIMASLFDRELKTEVAIAYVENLEDLPFHEVIKVVRQSIKTFDRFPMVAQIRRMVTPIEDPKDQANEMAGAILDAIRQFGYANFAEVCVSLGPEATFAIERFGGWNTLCATEIDALPTVRAQLRDICKTVLAMKERKVTPTKSLPEYQTRGMQKLFSAIDKSLIDVYENRMINSSNE
jgi:hypothetical protein